MFIVYGEPAFVVSAIIAYLVVTAICASIKNNTANPIEEGKVVNKYDPNNPPVVKYAPTPEELERIKKMSPVDPNRAKRDLARLKKLSPIEVNCSKGDNGPVDPTRFQRDMQRLVNC